MIIYSRVVSRATWRRLTRPGCCLVLGVSRVPNRNFTYFRPVFLEWYLARPQQNLANLQMTSRTSQGSTWAGAHSVSLPQGAPGWRFSVMRPRSVFPRGVSLLACLAKVAHLRLASRQQRFPCWRLGNDVGRSGILETARPYPASWRGISARSFPLSY